MNRNQNSKSIEELLCLNVRADRIVINGANTKTTEEKSVPIAVEWSSFAV